MEVILLEKVANLGGLGEKVSVKSGFGRNFLIPQGKAMPANVRCELLSGRHRGESEQRGESPALPGSVGERGQHDDGDVDGEEPGRYERRTRDQPRSITLDAAEIEGHRQNAPANEQCQHNGCGCHLHAR